MPMKQTTPTSFYWSYNNSETGTVEHFEVKFKLEEIAALFFSKFGESQMASRKSITAVPAMPCDPTGMNLDSVQSSTASGSNVQETTGEDIENNPFSCISEGFDLGRLVQETFTSDKQHLCFTANVGSTELGRSVQETTGEDIDDNALSCFPDGFDFESYMNWC